MLGTIVRFIVSAIVLMLVGFVIPGFSVAGFTGALVAAIVIAAIGYVAESLMGEKISPRSRGLVGFITAAVVIYLAQLVVPSMIQVTVIGALLAAFVVGIIDAFVPTTVR